MVAARSRVRAFCQALADETAGRCNWWVSIQKVARLAIDLPHSVTLAAGGWALLATTKGRRGS